MKQGDRNRSVRLLWEPAVESARGPRAALSQARVVEAAIRVADAEGVEALTMRRVAETLGFTTMSLYRHVPGKSELLDLMVDAVWGGTERTPKGPWREGLEFYARQMWSMYRAHPWLLRLTDARRMPGPNAMTRTDAAYAVVAEAGLRPEEIVAVVATVGQFVAGAGRAMADRILAELQEHFTPDRLPMMTRIWNAGGYERPLDEFEFGLARVLDGLSAFIEAKDLPLVRRETCL